MVCRYIERGRKPVISIPLDDTRLGLDNLMRGRCAARRGLPYQRLVGKKKFETVPSKCSDNGGGNSNKTNRPSSPQQLCLDHQEQNKGAPGNPTPPPHHHLARPFPSFRTSRDP